MPRSPRVTGHEVVRALRRAGFVEIRQTGSHLHLARPEEARIVTVPMHSGEIIKQGTLATILKQAGLIVDEFRELL